MASSQPQRSVYGVQLLDDLHVYFPDILYAPRNFQSVPDIMNYVQRQMAHHFNIFDRERASAGHSSVNTIHNTPITNLRQPSRLLRTPASTVSRNPPPIVRQSATTAAQEMEEELGSITITAAAPPLRVSNPATNQGTLPRTTTRTITNDLLTAMLTGSDLPPAAGTDPMVTLLNSLLFAPGTAAPTFPPNFLQPVPVRPTQEELDAGTTLRAAQAADEQNNCAICQDHFTEGQAIRSIRHCSHAFHRGCLDPWLDQNVHCPVCRHDIRTPLS